MRRRTLALALLAMAPCQSQRSHAKDLPDFSSYLLWHILFDDPCKCPRGTFAPPPPPPQPPPPIVWAERPPTIVGPPLGDDEVLP